MYNRNRIRKPMAVIILLVTIILSIISVLPTTVGQQDGMPMAPSGQEPAIDLQITDLTFSDDEPLEDDEIVISATIANNGSNQIDNLTIIFLLDNKELRSLTGLVVEANDSLEVNITWTAEKWNHIIGAMLSIGETPLQNTLVTEEISVESKPIGDVRTLILGLIFVFIIIFIISTLPSVWQAIKNKTRN